MSFLKPFLFFLVINFSALGIGSRLMGNGSKSNWYLNLNKAPWTPDGWVFGASWATLMICFAAYMAYLYKSPVDRGELYLLFGIQFILNISWNYNFFRLHQTQFALVIILSLTTLVAIFFIKYYATLDIRNLLILPYLIWMLIASSLNAFIVLKN